MLRNTDIRARSFISKLSMSYLRRSSRGGNHNEFLLSEKAAKEVKNLHGKAVGYADHVCKECTKYKDNAIFLIGVDTKKSKKEPWRTGEIAAIKDSCSLALKVKPNIATLKDRTTYCFIDQNLGKELGLWK